MRALWLLLNAPTVEEIDPPGAPTNLRFEDVGETSIRLRWDAPTTGGEVSLYRAQVSSDSGFGTILATHTTTGTSQNFTGLSAGTTYWFRVRAENAGGQSAYVSGSQATAEEPSPGAPAAPSGLSATEVDEETIALSWTSNSGGDEDGFRVYRSIDGGSYSAIGTTGSTSFTDTNTTLGSRHCYRVRAYTGSLESSNSNTDCVDDLGVPTNPPAPASLNASAVSGSRIDLSWTDAHGIPSYGEYEVYRDNSLVGTSSNTSDSQTGLSEATSYDFKVRARIGTWTSDFTSTVAQKTKLNTPTSFSAEQIGGTDELGFVRFSWINSSSKNDNYVLIRNGSDFRTLSGSTTQTDVNNADADGNFTLEARASGEISSNPAGPLSGPPWPSG